MIAKSVRTRRHALRAGAASLLAGVTVLVAPPAPASAYDPCRALTNGRLCVQHIVSNGTVTGVNIWFEKWGGTPVHARFRYSDGTFSAYDDGEFIAYPGTGRNPNVYSYAWNGTYPGRCITGYLETREQGTISTGQKCRDRAGTRGRSSSSPLQPAPEGYHRPS